MKELKIYLEKFAPISDSTWNRISELFIEKLILKNNYFIEENKIAHEIGFLKNGIIRAFYTNKKGIEYNKHFFTKNNLIGGYTSLINKKPNLISQQALTDCIILVANYDELQKLTKTCIDLERVFRKYPETLLINKENREIELVLMNADERYEIFKNQFPELEQIIPQYHIASYLGISATQLSRIRNKNKTSKK